MTTDGSIASRALISPSRGDDRAGEHAMAAGYPGAFMGFMGFMARADREHDFALGRRNCQGFLLNHFRLPERNARLFGPHDGGPGWTAQDRKRFGQIANGSRSLPLIPLRGTAAAEQALPDWPKNKLDPGGLHPALGQRATLVVPALSDEISTLLKRGGAARWALRKAHWVVVPTVEGEAMRRIASALTQLNAAGGP